MNWWTFKQGTSAQHSPINMLWNISDLSPTANRSKSPLLRLWGIDTRKRLPYCWLSPGRGTRNRHLIAPVSCQRWAIIRALNLGEEAIHIHLGHRSTGAMVFSNKPRNCTDLHSCDMCISNVLFFRCQWLRYCRTYPKIEEAYVMSKHHPAGVVLLTELQKHIETCFSNKLSLIRSKNPAKPRECNKSIWHAVGTAWHDIGIIT